MTTRKESEARLNVATKSIEKEYGHVVKWLGEAAEEKREVISTGCLGLDNAIGKGGLERGLIAEFFGRSGAGKSFLGYSVVKQACLRGYKCAIIDAENSLDPRLLISVGLPADQVLVVEGAPTGEANLSIADNLMQTGDFAVVMVDSVAALIPRVENNYDQQTIGLHARLMSAGIQKIMPVAKKTGTLLIFINQIRNKIGAYGNPETTTGGEALGFYSAYRVEVIGSPQNKSRRLQDEGTGEVFGHRTTFRVVKNKRNAPYREAEVDLIYGMGYDIIGETIDLGVDIGLIEKVGAWMSYKENKWQGRDKAKLSLMSNPALQSELEVAIRSIISGELPASSSTDSERPDDKPVSKKRARDVGPSVS
jgi:recombination protein RecA